MASDLNGSVRRASPARSRPAPSRRTVDGLAGGPNAATRRSDRYVCPVATTSELLRDARDYPQRLLSATDPKREPRAFTMALTRPLGQKRGKGRGSFVHDTRIQAFDFYRDVVQTLRAWQPKAPKLRDVEEDVEVPRVEQGAVTPAPVS